MRIARTQRVRYRHNPLAEVICQVRFGKTSLFENSIPEGLVRDLNADGYTVATQEQTFSFEFRPSANPEPPAQLPGVKVFHFSSADGVWKVSISADFFALSCTDYSSWEHFSPRLVRLATQCGSTMGDMSPTRLGLRYKDVIEREPLGLDHSSWSDLIQPFLLGPLGIGSLWDGQVDGEAVQNLVLQTNVSLEDCCLLLQANLLTATENPNQRAFLIDSDFYLQSAEGTLFNSEAELVDLMSTLHENAGSLFRRSITDKLHDALDPEPI